MRKKYFGRQLQRDTNERKALFKSLMNELVMHEQITTTLPKAKAIQGQVEKLVTKAKRRGENARNLLQPFFNPEELEKVISDLAVRFQTRPGGYTRIIKMGTRFYDNAQMAIIEWTEKAAKISKEMHGPKEAKAEKAEAVIARDAKQSLKKAAPKKKVATPKKAKTVVKKGAK